MKVKTYHNAIAATIMVGAAALATGCTDAWNDHYGTYDNVMSDQPNLLATLAEDASVANFYRVVQAIGMTDMLNSSTQLTLWAPTGLTEAQADSIIALYESEAQAGKEDDDNKAVVQFFQNHTALYARSISALTNDTIQMLNGKYMNLVGNSATSGTLDGNAFSDPVLCGNGILYKTENVQSFFPNIREYMELQTGMDSIVNLITTYDEYTLDENASVAGGVVDGKTVYLDSVTYLSNDLLSKYGYIQREDSTYYLIVPTDEVWKQEYDKYSQYYNYTSAVNNGDSLADISTKQNIVQGRFFNMSISQKHNLHPTDSICNTQYHSSQTHNPRQNVYYKPEQGILQGLEKVECSNGYVYIDNEGVIDPATTFFGRDDIDASSPRYYEIPTDDNNNTLMTVTTNSYGVYRDADSTSIKYYNYVQVKCGGAANYSETAQTYLDYTLADTYSNCYYNIYIVTVPGDLPLWFQVSQNVQRADGTFAKSFTSFNNPNPVTSGSVDNSDLLLKQSNNGRCYVASTEKVDTILIQAAVKYDYSGYGLDEGVVQMRVQSFGPSSANSREVVYTRTLRLNEIIMIPYETEEEALAAANDTDAFNDELLEANKEN